MSTVVAEAISLKQPNSGHALKRKIKDRTATVVVYTAFVLVMIPLVTLIFEVVRQGWKVISPYFLSVSMNGVHGGMNAGGIYHAIMGTLLITAWATLISVPIGLFTAVYLVEYGRGALAKAVTFFVDVMSGIPSIVAGLFAAGLFTLLVGPSYRAGIMGAVALSVLMIPVVVRTCSEMLLLVPDELREAALALGVPRWKVIVKVVLRTAAAGLTTSVMVAISRVIGETAPLLITVGMFQKINTDVFSDRMMTLPVYIQSEYTSTVSCGPNDLLCNPFINIERAWGAALVLIVIVMTLNLGARLISWKLAPRARH